jgi:hypothetical protein
MSKVSHAKQEIVAFVASRRQGKPAGKSEATLKAYSTLVSATELETEGQKL